MAALSISAPARFPQRPSWGTEGKPVLLWANYMQLIPSGNQSLFRYSIEFLKDEKGAQPVGKKCGRLINIFLEENFASVRDKIASDFRSTFISSDKVPFSDNPYNVIYRAEGEDEPSDRAKTYRIQIKSTGTLSVTELMNYLTSSDAGAMLLSKEEVIQALNIVVGNYPKTANNIFSVGANKHFPYQGNLFENFSLGSGLEALRGFFVSVRAATDRLLVNVQVKNTPCYQSMRLDHLMKEFLYDRSHGMLELDKFLKRVRVRITHIVKRNKSGKEIPRLKVISGLATPRDGQGQPNSARVANYGATADKVQFFLNSQGPADPPTGGNKKGKKGKGTGGKKGEEPPGDGQYISVLDFFKKSEWPTFPFQYSKLTRARSL